MKFNKLNCFSIKDKHFLFDGNTGNYFQLPFQSAEVVKHMINDKNDSIFSTIQNLYQKYNLTIPAGDKHIAKSPKIKSVAINVSSTCNLKCTYCWNNQGSYSQTKQSKIISFDDIDTIIVFLNSNAEYLDINQFELFGGEPLLDKNLVMSLVIKLKYFRPNAIIKISTNGTLIDEELADFFSTQGNIYIAISIDGNEKYHNENRPYPDGCGSYENALKGLSLIIKRDIHYSIRATLPGGVFAYKEYAKSFLERGIYNFTISKSDNDTPNYFDINDYQTYANIYQEYLLQLLDFYRESNIILPDLYQVLSNSLCDKIITKTNRCGAGCYMLGIDTEGNLYPCEILAGDKTTRLGNIRTTSVKDICNSTIYNQMKNAVFTACASCWLSAKCVVCYKCNLERNDKGDLFKVPDSLCKVKKLEMESVIWLTSLLTKKEREIIIDVITTQE